MITVACSCGKSLQAPETLQGKKVRCKSCQQVLEIPVPLAEALQEPEPLPEAQPEPRRRKRRKKLRSHIDFPVADSLEDRLRRQSDEKAEAESRIRPYLYLGGGLLCFAIGIGLFLWFASFEAEGGVRRVHVVIAILYNIGGKWLLAILCGLAGLFLCALALLNFMGISVMLPGSDD